MKGGLSVSRGGKLMIEELSVELDFNPAKTDVKVAVKQTILKQACQF
jgi:hypothetical protein